MNSTLQGQSLEHTRTRRLALVVDDLKAMQDLVEIALDSADFDVLRASSVAEARKVFQDRGSEIELLMTDIRVAGQSGLDLAHELQELRPGLKVLAMSDFAQDGRLIFPAHKFDFLPKPFSRAELKAKLKRVFTSQPEGVKVTVASGSKGTLTVSARAEKRGRVAL